MSTSHPSKNHRLFQTDLSNTLMYGTPKKERCRRQVCEHMCPELSADMLQCAVSVCNREAETDKRERETEKKKVAQTIEEREGMEDKDRKRNSSGKRGREEEEKGTAERQKASKSCMCVGSQPCQGPVSL